MSEIIETIKAKNEAGYREAMINFEAVTGSPAANSDGTTNIIGEAERHLDMAAVCWRRLELLKLKYGDSGSF